MQIIKVTKEFSFEMAHALWKYDGKCKHIHGHSYRLQVTIKGTPIKDNNHVKNGMVIDFGDLKKTIKETIVEPFDHALILNKQAPTAELEKIPEMFDKVILTDYQPTAENMLIGFVQLISKQLPSRVSLYKLRLYETHNSFVEWTLEDNPNFLSDQKS